MLEFNKLRKKYNLYIVILSLHFSYHFLTFIYLYSYRAYQIYKRIYWFTNITNVYDILMSVCRLSLYNLQTERKKNPSKIDGTCNNSQVSVRSFDGQFCFTNSII